MRRKKWRKSKRREENISECFLCKPGKSNHDCHKGGYSPFSLHILGSPDKINGR
jgi:hypothetical protein